MSQLPPSDVGDRTQHEEQQPRQHDGTKKLRTPREILEELKKKKEIPLRSCSGKLFSGVGRRAEWCAVIAQNEEDDDEQNGETRHRVA